MKKKILLTLLSVILVPTIFILAACSKTENQTNKTDFPLDEKGYPKNDVVIVNGKPYPLEIAKSSIEYSEVAIKLDDGKDVVEVVVPQYLPINIWSVDEKNILDLISYSRVDFPIKDNDMVEGISNSVQSFKFQVPQGETTILLKWSNVDEVEKTFKDKNEDYLLKIIISK